MSRRGFILLAVVFILLMGQIPSDIPPDAWKRKVRSVMSADTLVIEAEGGLDEVWLVCVKAPQVEAKEQLADEAREFVVNEVLGNDVWIVFDNPRNEPRRNRDGRYMAFVYYEKVVEVGPKKEPTRSFFFLNAELISRGLARVDTSYPCSKRLDFNALQREARQKRLGIWENTQ